MSGYPEGKHDDPADTQDRLVRVGAKYQATAPAVADGDNVYLLVDAAGRPLVVGAAAEDAAVLGNPLLAGVRYYATDRTLDDGDVGGLAVDASGRLKVAGPSANAPIAAMVVASEIKAARKTSATDSSVRATLLTPTWGKQVRILSVGILTTTATINRMEVYFATGATVATTAGKEIAEAYLDVDNEVNYLKSFPDGGGPVGAADDVVSIRTSSDITGNAIFFITYREE